MKRRKCMTLLAATAAGPALLSSLATLSGCASETTVAVSPEPGKPFEPIEVQDYLPLEKPLPVTLEPGKAVEVIEFFWYECPFCNAFEPLLAQWLNRQRTDVQFRYVPVGFSPRHEATQKLFYALEDLGQRKRLHAKIYAAIHRQSRQLISEKEQLDFVTAEGVDGARFLHALRSPQVAVQAQAAIRLADAYYVAGVPSLGIHGRFYTSTALASTRVRMLAVADALIQRCREGH